MLSMAKNIENESVYDPIQTKDEHKKFPRAVFIIILNEFCERFSYSGMRAFLALYLKQKLLYSEDEATEIYHIFTTMAYFFGIFGAFLADGYIGKFRTIVNLMVVYAIGNVIISVTAIPTLGIPGREFTLLGLMMIALGTGGIKPCVSSFGGDQFILPQQEKQLTMYFSMLYFILCFGSTIAKSVSPLLRSNVQCFGDKDCFSLAFGAPGILIILSIVIFICAKSMYIIKKPSSNVLVDVFKCIYESLKRQLSLKKNEKRPSHWLDNAQDSYDQKFINDIKKTLSIFLLFTPLLVFWALLDQMGSRWTLQATKMDGDFWFFSMKPDQIQVICPISLLILIPVFRKIIYPLLAKFNLLTNLLHRLTAGCFLAALAFVCTGVLEMSLEKTYPILPTEGIAQLRLFNGYTCDLHLSNEVTGESLMISPLQANTMYIKTDKSIYITYNQTIICKDFNLTSSHNLYAEENKATSYFFYSSLTSGKFPPFRYEDHVHKSRSGLPYVRLLTNGANENNYEIALVDAHYGNKELWTNSSDTISKLYEVFAGEYKLLINSKEVPVDIKLNIGGVYTIIIAGDENQGYNAQVITVTQANSVWMGWVLPQIIIISIGEVLFAISGLEFAFKEAPESMKVILQSYWLLIEAFGNILIIIITRIGAGHRLTYQFFFYTLLMLIATVVFIFLARSYERNNDKMEKKPEDNDLSTKYMEIMQMDETLDH